MSKNRTLAILNLAGELPKELAGYFASREIKVVDPKTDTTQLEWTHIFTRDVEDFTVIEETYLAMENVIHIVSLTKVQDLKNFVLNGGKMVFDEEWLNGSMGTFILDKFFQEYAGISIEENYPNFHEVGSFNVVNPFNTAEYLDKMVHQAFESNANALAIKTYFDHILMYLTGLKHKDKIGLPIEISYGTLNEVFGVQMHFLANELVVDDIVMCLSNSITKRAEEYLLNISVQSADFFDFTYLSGVNKVVITALWTSDPNFVVENRGLMFATLSPAAKMGSYPSDVSEAFLIQDGTLEDLTHKINIPDAEDKPDASFEAPDLSLEEEETVTVLGATAPEEEAVTTVSGGDEEKDGSQLVKGSKEEKDKFSQTLKGDKEAKDNFSMKIGGDKKDDNKGAFNVRSLGGKEDEKGAFGLKSLGGGNGNGKGGNSSPNSFFKSAVQTEKEKELEDRLKLAVSENDRLQAKVKILSSELQSARNTKGMMDNIQLKTKELNSMTTIKGNEDDELRKQFQSKLSESKQLSSQEMSRLSSLLEKESKYIDEARQYEIQFKKLQLELTQKDMVFSQELEKAQRLAASKDVIAQKVKETMTMVIEKKDKELKDMRDRFEQVSQKLASGPSQTHVSTIKDLEKQNANLNKMIEVYKNKITTLATTIEANKGDDSNSKDEARRLSMINSQLKVSTDTMKKELDKLKDKNTQDTVLIGNLRQDKIKLEQMVKKAAAEVPKAQATANIQMENDLKKMKEQNHTLEVQLRESTLKLKELEKRLADTLKNVKSGSSGGGEEVSKAKVSHLEASVKKLTGDLMASQNQTAEMKKDVNKLRSENQALQNQLAQTKKEIDKLKPASPKNGSGGKAA